MRQCDQDHNIELVVKRLTPAPQAAGPLGLLLSDAERERAARFAFDRDAQRFVMARAGLRQLLGDRLSVPPASVSFAEGPQGKLALQQQNPDTDLRFNLSHSGDLAVYALAMGREVGVDVEVIRPVPDAEGIVARWFSPRERAEYRSVEPGQKPLAFFTCWTRKEAVVKALGEGLSYPLDQVDVGVNQEPITISCGRGTWSVHTFFPADTYVAAVAVAVAPARQSFPSCHLVEAA